MRNHILASTTAIALTGGTLLVAAPAQAADPAVLYVRQSSAACSDSGPGNLEQPFCTVGAAAALVTAGQVVDVGAGSYAERVTIASSGTPDQPIVFRAEPSTIPTLSGPTAGFVIDGQHDITIKDIRVSGALDAPALDLRDASAITIEGGAIGIPRASTAPGVRLAGVTRSSLKGFLVAVGAPQPGVVMDAATSGVTVDSLYVTSPSQTSAGDQGVGVRVGGPTNTIINSVVNGFTGAAVAIEPGVTGTVVANNQLNGGSTYGITGYGIHNRGATGTAITNNTIQQRCRDGIRVDGASAGVSVQNNRLSNNGPSNPSVCGSTPDGVEIGVYDAAAEDIVVDYNNVRHDPTPSSTIYAWNGARMSLAAFRAASGQAAHDLETQYSWQNTDSANSAAPGYQATDRVGTARADDPSVANTGAGPVTYADRGATEDVRDPLPLIDVTLDLVASSVTVNASRSQPGFVPIASYEFRFGDGTVVTQTTPVASHTFTTPGTYTVSVKVIGADGRSASKGDVVSILPRIGTVGLIAQYNLKYVSQAGSGLAPNQAGLSAAGQLDIADAGSGQVALVARAAGRYVTVNIDSSGIPSLSTWKTRVEDAERFTLIRNGDGSISLRSVVNSRYVSILAQDNPVLVADRIKIGPWEKFYQVTVADAARSLKAGANSRYVVAESAGTKPLIANRTAVGPWERFDVVDLGNGQVALFARADNRFVAAESAGAKPLIANRSVVGAWERFTMVRNSDGTVSFKAAVNNRYVVAESAGTKPLIANRTAIGPWEKFTLG